jgi:hypothetical protein
MFKGSEVNYRISATFLLVVISPFLTTLGMFKGSEVNYRILSTLSPVLTTLGLWIVRCFKVNNRIFVLVFYRNRGWSRGGRMSQGTS